MPRLVKILISAVVVAVLAYLLGWSSVFTVKKVEFNGVTNPVEILAVEKKIGKLDAIKLARIEPRQMAKTIESISWVKSADVSRNWFSSSVTISIDPRVPIGVFAGRYIDSAGVVFDPIGTSAEVPRVDAPNTEIGLLAIELFTSLPEDFRQNVTSLRATSAADFTMAIKGPQKALILRFGSADDKELKIKVFKALAALDENKNISTIDVSAPHAPIVK
ncbi:cell division protein FtsQ [Candidatus Planktophila limnetica]|jgi:cell division septal protein FtsQ|uniref:Cell division protein FtsQ n=1 Tax=Candidatus Planktophila limnetica TaxID=573600 RepID=A0A249LFD0_9ACTN|nr:FtsQ-type POTRA domain-containing protein [Candidatus Planktophila limnetica]ASY27820.1 cell division protein FtsQ [Candidatus Planktophila limnetica]